MLQSRQESEDIVQGLFVDMLQRGETRFDLPYLYRAVTNRCLNHLRDSQNRQRLLDHNDRSLRGPARMPCDEQVIGVDLLLKLTDRLDTRCSEVLVYRFFDDMGVEEIATLLGTSRKTVGKRLGRIRAEVKRILKQNGGDA